MGILIQVLTISHCAFADPTKPAPVQIDLGKLLNARVVFTQKDGQLQPADHSLDRGYGSLLTTASAAFISHAGKIVPLPDAGFFAANHDHPDVQLAYGTARTEPQVCQTTARTKTIPVPVPTHHYTQMQLFFISAQGPTPISVTLQYADGSSTERDTRVPDFYWLLKPEDKGWFVLANGFGKVDTHGVMTEYDHHFIHGFNLDPDPLKRLQSIAITKKDSGSVLNLFGATGTLSAGKDP